MFRSLCPFFPHSDLICRYLFGYKSFKTRFSGFSYSVNDGFHLSQDIFPGPRYVCNNSKCQSFTFILVLGIDVTWGYVKLSWFFLATKFKTLALWEKWSSRDPDQGPITRTENQCKRRTARETKCHNNDHAKPTIPCRWQIQRKNKQINSTDQNKSNRANFWWSHQIRDQMMGGSRGKGTGWEGSYNGKT